MANMIIRPATGIGNKVIVQDQAGAAVLTTADSGATVANATLTTPTIASMANCTFPAGHVVQTVFNTYNAQNSDVTNSTTFARVSKDSVYHWKGQIDNVGASNHVLIHMTFGFSLSKTAINVGAGFGVFRDTTAIFTPSEISWYWQASSSTLIERYKQASITWMDTSPGTGTNEYYLGFKNNNSSSLYVRSGSGHIPFVCTLMEIAR